ncbi:Cysteine desulfurase IscS [Tessaracoccus lapidicaptus]|nr:Cysteine desulfurase IscS [Tessaracoccus lapidicaptus]
MVGRPVYLDYNGTTPVDPAVLEAMLPFLSREFGNPSSSHAYGQAARQAVEVARMQVSDLIGGQHGRVVFTGSGSEADALAIRGAVLANRREGRRPHVITQATEHPAVLAACADLAELHGVDVTVVGVDGDGLVDPGAVAAAITESTVMVSVMHANNETGTIQPIAEIARAAHSRGVLVHCDAAQSAGKVNVDVAELGVDLLTVVGHKMYAPKGVAALWVRDGVRLRPLVGGGGQEGGLRAGTENVAYIAGFGHAALLAGRSVEAGEAGRLTSLRDHLQAALERLLPGRVHLNGHPVRRLPNTLNISIDDTRALSVLSAAADIAASAGSACHSGRDTPSEVLAAMGIETGRALSAIRLSMGRWTTLADVDRAAAAVASASRELR